MGRGKMVDVPRPLCRRSPRPFRAKMAAQLGGGEPNEMQPREGAAETEPNIMTDWGFCLAYAGRETKTTKPKQR